MMIVLVPLSRSFLFVLSKPFAFWASFVILGNMAYGQSGSKSLTFSTYIGDNTDPGGTYFSEFATIPSASDKLTYRLKQFDLSNGSTSALDQVTSYSGSDEPQNGDLIELGFFDTDPADDGTSSTISPGTDVNSPFKGEWTPLTDKLRIGYDHTSSDTWGAGHYGFKLKFQFDGGVSTGELKIGADNFDASARTELSDSLGQSIDVSNNLADRYNALDANSLIGIRYYDQTDPSAQTTRYNTIMHSSWKFVDDAKITLFDPSTGSLRSNLLHEFGNSNYNSISDIGTGGTNAVGTDDFVATITYYDGTSTLDLDNTGGIGDTVLSGLNSNGNSSGIINVGDDSNILTINTTSGNRFTYDGTVREGTGAGAASLVKTGFGEQIFTGNINLAGSSTGFVDVYEGNFTFKGAGQKIEYLTSTDDSDAGTTPIVKLDNTNASGDVIVELGFANTSTAQTFDGNVILSGGNSAHEIKIASGASDYDKTQIITGTITGSSGQTLVKDGSGILALHGDSASSMDGNITIQDGTLLIGDGSDAGADPGDGNIIITKGKLEIADSETIDNTIKTEDSNKSVLGGTGTYNGSVTIGSADGQNFVDVISPGSGISSSLSSPSSQQQVSLGNRTGAEGNFTVGALTLAAGGVYDWEISDFSGTAGADWDLLLYDSLSYNTSDTFNINIFGLEANGSAGPLAGGSVWQNFTNNGFKFMEVAAGGTAWTGVNVSGSNPNGTGYLDNMAIDSRGWSYHNNHWAADWSVWYEGSNTGAFYLQYSAVPEPSTYIMVTGLMLVPGMNAVRKYRNRKKKQGLEESEEEILS